MNNRILGNTRVCGVIGDPIEHSLSPVIFNAAFKKCGLPYIYVPFKVRTEELADAIRGMKALNIVGLNVTIPHKVAVMDYLEEVDPLAQKIGAVNTIVNNNGRLKGYNTDASGFVESLKENKIDVKNKMVVIIGAGGAARAVCFALAESGAQLIIINRTFKKAHELYRRLIKYTGAKVTALKPDDRHTSEIINKADIIVNTTSVGMFPAAEDIPIAINTVNPRIIVYDIVYNPIETSFLKLAKKSGAKTISGLEMLLWQAALAFEKWTGQKAPIEIMRQEIIRELEKLEN